MHSTSIFAAILISGTVATAAEAAMTVIGNTTARQCYEAADLGRSSAAALSVCNDALDDPVLSRDDRAATYVNRGIVNMRRRQFIKALADYDAALAVNGDLAEAHTNRGIALWYSKTDNQAALAALTKGLELDTGEPEVAYYMRAGVNEALGNVEAAYRDYRQAVEISPRWLPPQQELERFQVVNAG